MTSGYWAFCSQLSCIATAVAIFGGPYWPVAAFGAFHSLFCGLMAVYYKEKP